MVGWLVGWGLERKEHREVRKLVSKIFTAVAQHPYHIVILQAKDYVPIKQSLKLAYNTNKMHSKLLD